MSGTSSKNDRHFRLRLPVELAEKIEASATQAKRALNADVVRRLEFSFEAQMALPDVQRLARDRRDLLELNNSAMDLLKETQGTMLKQASVIRFIMGNRERFPDLAEMIEKTGLYDDASDQGEEDDASEHPPIDLHADDGKVEEMRQRATGAASPRAPGVPPGKPSEDVKPRKARK